MRNLLKSVALAGVLAAGASSAQAGVYTDDMSKCLVSKTTAQDKSDLVRWIFLAMSAHPTVSSYANVKDGQRQQESKTTAELMQRLLLTDCRKETMDAVRYEGAGAIEKSFEVLGEVAMRELMSDPKVDAAVSDLANHLDEKKFEELGKAMLGAK